MQVVTGSTPCSRKLALPLRPGSRVGGPNPRGLPHPPTNPKSPLEDPRWFVSFFASKPHSTASFPCKTSSPPSVRNGGRILLAYFETRQSSLLEPPPAEASALKASSYRTRLSSFPKETIAPNPPARGTGRPRTA
jgi:hypothetical protein